MALTPMFKGLVNSPETTINNNINTADTIIYVLDPARVPDQLPNLMTLGTGTNAETVKVLSIDDNALTVERGFQGVAKDWLAGTIIARNFTEYDHNSFKENIETLDGGKVDKIAGRGLSTEDYTTAEKTKLAGVATGANKIIVNNTLTSTSTTAALSAAQGKVLKDAADAHLAESATQAHLPKNVGLGNVDNIKQMPISGGVLENYREKLVTLSGTSTAINLSLGNVFTHTLTDNTTYSITNAVNGQAHSFTLIVNMGSTVRTLTFPASVKWQDGEIPDMTTASKTYVLTFMTVDGGTNWLGMFGGEF